MKLAPLQLNPSQMPRLTPGPVTEMDSLKSPLRIGSMYDAVVPDVRVMVLGIIELTLKVVTSPARWLPP